MKEMNSILSSACSWPDIVLDALYTIIANPHLSLQVNIFL